MFRHYKFENNVLDIDEVKDEITKSVMKRKVKAQLAISFCHLLLVY